jgi:hypothetical protein
LLFAGANDAAYAGLFTRPLAQRAAVQWLQAHAPRDTSVGLESLPTGLVDLPYFVSAADYRPCILQFEAARLVGPARFVLTDRYSLEEHPRIPGGRVLRFLHALDSSPSYHLAARVHDTPSFLGIPFPIDGSPHDWRYPDRTINIYERVTASPARAPYCFDTIGRAISALYHPGAATIASTPPGPRLSNASLEHKPAELLRTGEDRAD